MVKATLKYPQTKRLKRLSKILMILRLGSSLINTQFTSITLQASMKKSKIWRIKSKLKSKTSKKETSTLLIFLRKYRIKKKKKSGVCLKMIRLRLLSLKKKLNMKRTLIRSQSSLTGLSRWQSKMLWVEKSNSHPSLLLRRLNVDLWYLVSWQLRINQSLLKVEES